MGDSLCEFRMFHSSEEWKSFEGGPAYGEPSGDYTPIKRCPRCNRRLRMKAIYCIGGEFTCWVIPPHKPRETRRPGPRRISKINGRGK